MGASGKRSITCPGGLASTASRRRADCPSSTKHQTALGCGGQSITTTGIHAATSITTALAGVPAMRGEQAGRRLRRSPDPRGRARGEKHVADGDWADTCIPARVGIRPDGAGLAAVCPAGSCGPRRIVVCVGFSLRRVRPARTIERLPSLTRPSGGQLVRGSEARARPAAPRGHRQRGGRMYGQRSCLGR